MTEWLDFINRADGNWATWGLYALIVLIMAVLVWSWSSRNRRSAARKRRDEEQSRLRDI